MIIDENKNDIIVDEESTSKKATISASKMAKLQYLLTKGLYKDPITAVIAEWVNNGVDSIVQAGKDPIDNPVIVHICKNLHGQFEFSVQDEGTGLDKDDFENICMNYLESTKEGDNDTIGHFGIGMKSFLSLERPASFICRKDGKERFYTVYEGPEFVNYDMIYEKDTDQPNGVRASLIIKDYNEKNIFETKALQKLAYYDTVLLYRDGRLVDNNIYRNELFQWSSTNSNKHMHLCLKDVYYNIDWEALGIRQTINMSIALRFNLDSGLTPTPSRESYITNEKTKELLKERIGKVADWFISRFNDNHKPEDSFFAAYDKIGSTTKYITLEGQDFVINPLISYSSIIPKEMEIKGITLRDPSFYKGQRNSFFEEYERVAVEMSYIGRRRKYLPYIHSHFIDDKHQVVIVDSFIGNVRQYLKEKYSNVLFVRKNPSRRGLGFIKRERGANCYYYLLNLHREKKERWRGLIEEWLAVEKTMTDQFIDETACESSKAYEDWLQKKRDNQKERRRLGLSTNYNALNKQQGDVTLAYWTKGMRSSNFKKRAYPIAGLSKNRYLTVMLKEEEKPMFSAINNYITNDRINFAIVGNHEIKKVPQHHQFINYQQFIMSKSFGRIASAILFKDLLDKFDTICSNAPGIFEHCIKGYTEKAKILNKYVEKNIKRADEDFRKAILEVAEEKDLFDKEHWIEYLHIKKGVEKYDWLTCLQEPAKWDTEEIKKFKTVINQVLLFRKKYYNEFPEGATVVIVKEEIEEGPKTEEEEDDSQLNDDPFTNEEDFDEIEPERGDDEFDTEGEIVEEDFRDDEMEQAFLDEDTNFELLEKF